MVVFRTALLTTLLVLLSASVANAATPGTSWPTTPETTATKNVYAFGATLVRTAPTSGDYTAAAGSIVLAGPIKSDALLVAGTVASRADIAGDLRIVGGTVNVSEAIAGDLAVLGLKVSDSAPIGGDVLVVGGEVSLGAGARGPVTIYGNSVTLAGTYDSDVRVVASGSITLASSTVMHGAFTYSAPEKAAIPDTAIISGGVTREGSSFFPNADTSRLVSFASVVIFILARILGALILAGLLAGLFPRLAEALSQKAHAAKPRTLLLTTLLGFAALSATPILLLLLALTFVGIGLSLLMLIAYALLALLSFVYAGILLGAAIARRFSRRETVLWRDGVVGILLLSLIPFVPLVGWFFVALLTLYAAGALLLLFFRFAFPQEEIRELL